MNCFIKFCCGNYFEVRNQIKNKRPIVVIYDDDSDED